VLVPSNPQNAKYLRLSLRKGLALSVVCGGCSMPPTPISPPAFLAGSGIASSTDIAMAKRNHYIVVEIPRGASSAGRRVTSNHERMSDHVRYIAAWPHGPRLRYKSSC
jgi:hypothetical protein